MGGVRINAVAWVALGAALSIPTQAPAVLPVLRASTSIGERAIYEPLPAPVRLLDTRKPDQGPFLSGGVPRTLQVTGAGGVPADATAVVLTVTVAKPNVAGYLTVYPTGATRPVASNLNYAAGQNVANLVTATLGGPGAVDLYVPAGKVHAVVDVAGYYRAHDHDDRYFSKDQAQARTAPNAFTCPPGSSMRSVADDGATTCVALPVVPERTSPFLGEGAGSLAVPAGSSSGQSGDFYRHDLTLGAGATLVTNGYRIVVSGTLTLGEGATIHRNGNAGTLNAAGGALGPGSLGGSGAGACSTPSTPVTNSLGGPGNNMGATGTIAVRPVQQVGGIGVAQWFPAMATGRTYDGAQVTGGAGGGGGACTGTAPGGGGGGGGVVVVIARHIVLTGAQAFVTADGGSSAAAGGGGGGVVVVASFDPLPAGMVLRAAGGTSGGNAAWTGGNGFTKYFVL